MTKGHETYIITNIYIYRQNLLHHNSNSLYIYLKKSCLK